MPGATIRAALLAFGMLAVFSAVVQADPDVVLDHDTVIASAIDDSVIVTDGFDPPDPTTVVDMVSGGLVTGSVTVGDWMHNFNDTATLNVLGGLIQGGAKACCHSTVNMSAGSLQAGLTSVYHSTVNVSGGAIAESVQAEDWSVVDLSGGQIGGGLIATQNSIVNLSGGEIGGSLSAVLYGTLNVYGSDLHIIGTTLTGRLADGTSLNHETCVLHSGQIVLHDSHVIPEPFSAAFTGSALVAFVAWRLRKRRTRKLGHKPS